MVRLEVTVLVLVWWEGGRVSAVGNPCEVGSPVFRSCAEIKTSDGDAATGVYNISITCSDLSCCKQVYCHMEIMGGGWTVFQRRYDGSVDFNQNWAAYQGGFGSVYGEHWLGLESLHSLTSIGGSIDLLVKVHENEHPDCLRYHHYRGFGVGTAASKYQLTLTTYLAGNLDLGTCASSTWNTIGNGMRFSTPDQDNDGHSSNCASTGKGGWWYHGCHQNLMNGGDYAAGCTQDAWQGIQVKTASCHRFGFAGSALMLRPSNFAGSPVSNLCTPSQTEISKCTATATGFSGRDCGPWTGWTEWSECADPAPCGSSIFRSRQKTPKYDQYTDSNCLDGSTPGQVQKEHQYCIGTCDIFCQNFTKDTTQKVDSGLIDTLTGSSKQPTVDMESCSQACNSNPGCRAFQVDLGASECSLADDTMTLVPNTDPDVFLYLL